MAKKGGTPMDSISLDNVLQANAPSGQLNQSMFQVITTASSTRKVGVVVGYCLAVGVIATTLCHCTPRQPHSQQHTFCRLFFFRVAVDRCFLVVCRGAKTSLCARARVSGTSGCTRSTVRYGPGRRGPPGSTATCCLRIASPASTITSSRAPPPRYRDLSDLI